MLVELLINFLNIKKFYTQAGKGSICPFAQAMKSRRFFPLMFLCQQISREHAAKIQNTTEHKVNPFQFCNDSNFRGMLSRDVLT